MSKEYREVAKKLQVKYLFGKYGISFKQNQPGGTSYYRVRIERLDGWTFDPHEIVEAIANDPDMSIKYGDKHE